MFFIIKQIGFDSSENHNPRYEIDLGYIELDTQQEAIVFASNLTLKHGNKYEGYDRNQYPQFKAVEIKRFNEIQII